MRSWLFKWGLIAGGIVAIGYALPETRQIPVKDAAHWDWNTASFWYEPWGSSGVHKGIDIFAAKGQPVLSATDGVVLWRGELEKGGNAVIVLGPRWRVHYYAHLSKIDTRFGRLLHAGNPIGAVGDTGNATGKQPHLHYSIINVIPRPWRADDTTQGYKKAWFEDPDQYLLTQTF